MAGSLKSEDSFALFSGGLHFEDHIAAARAALSAEVRAGALIAL